MRAAIDSPLQSVVAKLDVPTGDTAADPSGRHRRRTDFVHYFNDDLVITYFISGVGSTTLPVFIFGMLRRGIKPEINAIASLMILFSLVVASLGLWFRPRSSR